MRRQAAAKTVPGGARVFLRIFTRLGCPGRPPHFVAEFHPYADLTHTIRLREDVAYIRLSDALRGAPLSVFEAAAALLLARLYRRRLPREMAETYRRFSYARATRARLLRMRQKRGRRVQSEPRGAYHDLGKMFDELNRRYFPELLPRPRLGWSTRGWRAQLGCFDPALDQIVINRELDKREVPKYVVAYVLYHEMLHLKHPMRFARCRLESHSAGFRKEERRFAHYERAQRFLEKFT